MEVTDPSLGAISVLPNLALQSELIATPELYSAFNMEVTDPELRSTFNMKAFDPSLGAFSVLPGEVRIKIWSLLTPKLHVGRSLPRKPDYLPRDQNILLTSRKIYKEIAAEVPSGYQDSSIVIFVRPEFRTNVWVTAKNPQGAQWDLKDPADAIARGFGELPWANLNVEVRIFAPHGKDDGQILCLYRKVQALVDMLKNATGLRSLFVVFGHTTLTSWFDNVDSYPRRSILNMARYGEPLAGVHWDFDFLFPLFVQIRNLKMARMYSTELFEAIGENLSAFTQVEGMMISSVAFNSAEDPYRILGKTFNEHLTLLSMLVERIVDDLPSKTADMLRLERFSSWYTDKLDGNSPYEERLAEQLLFGMQGTDTLATMNHRYRIMRCSNPLSPAFQSAFPTWIDPFMDPGIDARGWSRESWYRVYLNGIPPLNCKGVETMLRKWSMEDDHPEKGGEFVKLFCYFSLQIGRTPNIWEAF